VTRTPALAALVLTAALATGLAGATQVAGQAASTTATAHGPTTAPRGTSGTWTKVSTGSVGITFSPSLARGQNGDLHLVYARQLGSSTGLMHTSIHTNGQIAEQNAITASGWSVMDSAPVVLSTSSGLRVVFGGLHDTGSGFFDTGRMYTATADAAGSTWTIPAENIGMSTSAYGSYGTAAVNLADGTPVAAFPLGGDLRWHVGTDSSPDGDFHTSHCCVYSAALARDGSNVYLGWYQNGSTAATNGTFVQRILPTQGPVVKAPGSSKGTNSLPTGRVALAARAGGGVFAAYCVGYPTCSSVRIWKVGTTKTTDVPHSKYAGTIAMSPSKAGRLWLAWSDNLPKVHAVRTDTTGLHLGVIRNAGIPKGGAAYSIAIDGTIGRGDIVLNDGSGMWHTQVVAGLTLKASPTTWRHHTSQKVTFTVKDAGDAVAGARVAVGSKSCDTSGQGTCTLTFPSSYGAGKHTARATKSGYGPATAGLKVR
jgi:hypothetical protein